MMPWDVTHLPSADLSGVQVGDKVCRYLAGIVPMDLVVTEVTGDRVVCGPWTFDRKTGAEIDEDLDWGPPPLMTGSVAYPYANTSDRPPADAP